MKYWQRVERFTDRELAEKIVPRRRNVIPPVPGMELERSMIVQRELFEKFGLEAYKDLVSAEMSSRPVPQVSAFSGKLLALAKLCEERLPRLLAYISPLLTPPVQTFNKVSKMGWPYFCRPEDKASRALWSYNLAKATSQYLKECFTSINIRLQPEKPDKVRQLQFITDSGEVQDRDISGEDRAIYVKGLGAVKTAQRTRLVFNKPANNLIMQIADTALNNVWMTFPLCSNNMYDTAPRNKIRRHVLALDVKHMERFTGAIIATRTLILGGEYRKQHDQMDEGGFLVPSDTWRSYWRLSKVASRMLVQFGSGHSAVAPSQKEALICILWAMHVELWGMQEEEALEAVLSGDTPYLHIMNYGDDNFWSAHDPSLLDAALDFASRYLDCEPENPPKFLGFTWSDDRVFRLSHESYLLKTYLHERAPLSTFRKYPYFGWTEKRKIYAQYGDHRLMKEVFDVEEDCLSRAGLPWSAVLQRSEAEREAAMRNEPSPNALFGKDYLMTAEEKIASGAFDGMYPDETAPLLHELLDGSLF